MRLRRHIGRETAATSEDISNPYSLVEHMSSDLAQSAAGWAEAASVAAEFSSAADLPYVSERIRDIYVAAGLPLNEQLIQSDTIAAANSLSILTLMLCRNTVTTDRSLKSRLANSAIMNEMYNAIPDENVRFLYANSRMRVAKHSVRLGKMSVNIMEAEDASKRVIETFVTALDKYPGIANETAEIYRDNAASISPVYAEFRRVIAADWQKQRLGKSTLAAYILTATSNPDQFIGSFSDKLEAAEHDKRLVLARKMAQFAIKAIGGNEDLSVNELLYRTQDLWKEYEEFKVPFDAHVKESIQSTIDAITTIAGQMPKHSIRTLRTQPEIDEYVRTIAVRIGQRQTSKTRSAKSRQAERSIPNIADVKLAMAEAKAQPERKLQIVKRNISTGKSRGEDTIEVESTDKMATLLDVDRKSGTNLYQDCMTIIEAVRQSPLSVASKRLNASVIIGGKSLRLLRFAPNDAPGLRVNSENRYHRLVYCFDRDNVYVIDFLDHADFDKRFERKHR